MSTYQKWVEQLCQDLPEEFGMKRDVITQTLNHLASQGFERDDTKTEEGVDVARAHLASYAFSVQRRWQEFHQDCHDSKSVAIKALDLELSLIVGTNLIVGTIDM